LSYIYENVLGTGDLPLNSNNSIIEPEFKFDEDTTKKIDKFKEYITCPYDEKNEKHEKLLLYLWKICFPNVELKDRISKQWKDLGFQGTNPSTDFRGVGVYGLWNILYFATTYPKQFNNMFNKSKKSGSYPFIIAGFNVTMMLYDILGWGIQSKNSKNYTAKKNFVEILVGKDPKWDQSTWFIFEYEDFDDNSNKKKI